MDWITGTPSTLGTAWAAPVISSALFAHAASFS
jgi:hypothetical protein